MEKEEIKKLFKEEYTEFMNYHNKQIKKLKGEGAQNEYVKKNKLNEKLIEMQKKYQKLYKDAKE